MTPSAPMKTALESAAHWYAVLYADDVSEAQRREHRAWLDADPLHQQAWQQVEQLRQQLQAMPGSPALQTLQRREHYQRRAVLRGLAVLASGGMLGTLAWQQTPVGPALSRTVRGWTAQYHTGRGEQHRLTLDDGTQLMLNTATALDIVETADSRLIRLYDGEIWVKTAHAAGERPASSVAKALQVHTEQGVVVPLGTVFTVRQRAHLTQVGVIEAAVELLPLAGSGPGQRLHTGEQARMDRQHVTVSALSQTADSWTQGLLVAVDWPLHRLLAELARYRPGRLRCDPDIAQWRVTGTFPLGDPERALQAIMNALPVRVERWTNYWVTLHAAPRA